MYNLVRLRVIAYDSENKAGQLGAVGRMYSFPAPTTKSSKFKSSKSTSIFSYTRKRSCYTRMRREQRRSACAAPKNTSSTSADCGPSMTGK